MVFQTNSGPLRVLCVYLTEREWLLVCVFACIPECIPVCIVVCVCERQDCEIFLFCASSNVSQPSQVAGTQVWFDRAHLQAVHAVRGP